jgi:hypothetical protein
MSKAACALLAVSALASAHAESALEFLDLRVQAGIVETRNPGGAITLMAGNIGDRDNHVMDPGADFGIVIGLRTSLSRLHAHDDETDVDVNFCAAGPVGGIGYYVSKRQHIEFVAGWQAGRPTVLSEHGGFHNDGYGTIWSGEMGWYYTFKKGIQFGLVGGWSWTHFTAHATPDSDAISGSSNGVGLAGSLGYRF